MSNNQSGVIHMLVLLILLIGIIGGVYLVQQKTNLFPKAQEENYIQIVDKDGNPITETDTPNVYLKITLPPGWELPKEQTQGLVKEAFAQECPQSGNGTTTTFGSLTYDTCVDNQGGTSTSGTLCSSASATKFRCYYSNNSNCISGKDISDFNYDCPAKSNTTTLQSTSIATSCQDSCGACQVVYTCDQQTYDTCDTSSCRKPGATADTTFNCFAKDNFNCDGLNTYKCNSCAKSEELPPKLTTVYVMVIRNADGFAEGGSSEIYLNSGFGRYLNQVIPWKLNELPNDYSAERKVAVTFEGSGKRISYDVSILLKKSKEKDEPPGSDLPKVDPTNQTIGVNVLVLKYFPITPEGLIDKNVTGDVDEPLSVIKKRTDDSTNALKKAIEKGTIYLGYKDKSAQPALRYKIVDTKEYKQAVPIQAGSTNKPDLDMIMRDHNICDYVDNSLVKEVWLWAYQGPGPKLAISESQLILGKVHSDISASFNPFAGFVDIFDGVPGFANGPYYPVPRCQSSYRIYTFNYVYKTSSAFESWGHQIERELRMTDLNLFVNLWQGEPHPQKAGVIGRCGSIHNPPNARSEYDRANSIPQKSDCLDWNPDGLGKLSDISCKIWGCSILDEFTNEPSLNYMIWNWQNMPGRNNTKVYQGKKLRNWWDVHGDFDNVMRSSRKLTL